MKYQKFIIENYKGIKKIILDLNKIPNSKIFTLVGLNESGKTSILEAINLLRNNVNDKDAHKLIPKNKKSNFNESVSVKAYLNLDEEDKEKIIEYCKKIKPEFKPKKNIDEISIKKKYTFENSNFKNFVSEWSLSLEGTLGRGKTVKSLYKIDKEAWNKVVHHIEINFFPKILYYSDFLFEFPEKIYLEEIQSEGKKQKEYRKVLQDILDHFGDGRTIETHILERLKSNSEENLEALDSILSEMSSLLTEKIFKSWEEIFEKSNKEIEILINKDNNGHYIQVRIKQGKDKYFIQERSLGFRWFFSFLLFTEFRKERIEDLGETLFLLDEPANNLHQNAQQKLLNTFEKLTSKCKLIYSTHSHHLINPKFLSGTYIIRNKAINYENDTNFNQDETDIDSTRYSKFVSSYPSEEVHFKPILDSLSYQPSQLELIAKIICLEGKFDYYTFKFVEKILVGKETYHFYPGASVDKYENLFRLYLGWNKDFIAIFDGDKGGIKAKKRYCDEVSLELNNKIFLLSDINKSWDNFQTENLFSEEDKMKIINILFPKEKSYNKSKFNTVIQELYINNHDFSLSLETKKNFELIFDWLKQNV